MAKKSGQGAGVDAILKSDEQRVELKRTDDIVNIRKM